MADDEPTCAYTPCDESATHVLEVDGEDRRFCHRHALEARAFSPNRMPSKIE